MTVAFGKIWKVKTENTKKLSVTFGELDRMLRIVFSECLYLFPCSRISGRREHSESDWEPPTGDFGGVRGELEFLTSGKSFYSGCSQGDRCVEVRYCSQLLCGSR